MKKEIRVLSVRQPWAHLIIHGACIGINSPITEKKTVENRTWKTKYRGELYIHASGKPMSLNKYFQWCHFILEEYGLFLPTWYKGIDAQDTKDRYPLQHGEIIGSVQLRDVGQNFVAGDGDWYMGKEVEGKTNYGWRVAWQSALEKPIPVKGKLGIWRHQIENT